MRFLKENPIAYLAIKTWQYSKGRRHIIVTYHVLFLLANAVWLAQPFVLARVFDAIQQQGVTAESLPRVLMTLSIFLVITFLGWMFHGPARVLERTNSFLVRANYKKFLLDGVMALPAQWHTDHHSGDTIDKIEKGSTALFTYASHNFEVIEVAVRLTASFVVLALFNIHSTYIVAILTTMTFAIILAFDKKLAAQYKLLFGAENKIAAKIYDTISNITTVIILRIEKLVGRAIWKRIMSPYQLYRRNAQLIETKWFIVAFCATVMTVGVVGSYLWIEVAAGATVAIGSVYIVYDYVRNIESIFYRFAYKYGQIVEQKSAVLNAELLSNEFKKIEHVKQVKLSRWNELRIDNLTFSYDDKKRNKTYHLKNVSVALHPGEKIALVGESGSGKTTLLKMLRGLYKAEKVHVKLDGQELEQELASISDSIALIPQEPEIFTTTIKENITVGVRRTKKELKRFMRMAQFTSVVKRLPHGLESSIVEKGVNLSGGEKQRLALARGLMASDKKDIVLLDEPTSSVDPQNERKIYENIFKAFPKKTVVSSVHRLHLLPMFDTICLFRNGRIYASGSFEDLKKNSKTFRNIWEKYQGEVKA